MSVAVEIVARELLSNNCLCRFHVLFLNLRQSAQDPHLLTAREATCDFASTINNGPILVVSVDDLVIDVVIRLGDLFRESYD